jgi:hypothetical protein
MNDFQLQNIQYKGDIGKLVADCLLFILILFYGLAHNQCALAKWIVLMGLGGFEA